jgi:tRNA threonylcarbamoyladenosine biosynthesis protein TsaB
MILALKTDQPRAYLALISDTGEVVSEHEWLAHKELEKTLLSKITDQLHENNKTLQDLSGLVIFAGPGSFTGLRIGFAVINTLAASLSIPNISSPGEDWLISGLELLKNQKQAQILIPEYGGEANITKPTK